MTTHAHFHCIAKNRLHSLLHSYVQCKKEQKRVSKIMRECLNTYLIVCTNMTRCGSVLPGVVSPVLLCSSPALLSVLLLPKSCSLPTASLSPPAQHAAYKTHKHIYI